MTKNTHAATPLLMEDYFSPGLKAKPAVHVGSQTMRLYLGDLLEQAVEGAQLAAAGSDDVVVLRNFDEDYIEYWKKLIGTKHIINLKNVDQGDYLSNIILSDKKITHEIKTLMHPSSSMMVYFPTEVEQQLAEQLGIPLHGVPEVSINFGTKSGIRTLAEENKILMPPGFICRTINDVERAISTLGKTYEEIVIKHDLSSQGRWSKKIKIKEIDNIPKLLDELSDKEFIEGRDVFVVEAWVKSSKSICVHIEIQPDKDPILCGAWEQVFEEDNISYKGAGPLMLSDTARDLLLREAEKLAQALKSQGAIGSFGPDFVITAQDEKSFPEDTCLLIELNARIPFTAYPLEIVKEVRGKIGNGFFNTSLHLTQKYSFSDLALLLTEHNLLIKERDPRARGVVPYNIGLLKWNSLYFVAMADTWHDAEKVYADTVKLLLQKDA